MSDIGELSFYFTLNLLETSVFEVAYLLIFCRVNEWSVLVCYSIWFRGQCLQICERYAP